MRAVILTEYKQLDGALMMRPTQASRGTMIDRVYGPHSEILYCAGDHLVSIYANSSLREEHIITGW